MMSCACEWVETRSTGDCRQKGPRSARLSLQLGNTAITWLLSAHTVSKDGMKESKECVSGAESSKDGVMRFRMR